MEPSSILRLLFSTWGIVTIVLVVLLIYRAMLSSKEDDQIFIDEAEHLHSEEQHVIVARMTRLRTPIIALTAISVVLLLSSISLWVYQGWMNP